MQGDAGEPLPPPLCDVTLAVLAGGAGARMGFPKAGLRVGGRPILRYLVERLAWPGPTLLVTAPGRERPEGHDAFDAEAVDPAAGLGPLRGVLTALEHARTPAVVVLPVDMPGMATPQLEWLVVRLLGRPEAHGVITRVDGEIQPFPAALRASAAGMIRARFEAGIRSMRRVARAGDLVVLPAPATWPAGVWANLNRPEDVAAFATEHEAPGTAEGSAP